MKKVLLALALCTALRAQDADPAAKPEKPPESAEQLAQRQAEIARRLRAIEETMQRIKDLLARTDPDKAARLELAWRRSRTEDKNLEKARLIEDLLKSEYWQDAIREQRDFGKAIEKLLDLLLDRDAERKETQERVERLEQARAALEKVLEQERSHFQETEKYSDPEKTLQRVAAAKARLSDLLQRQQGILEGTAANPAAGAEELERRIEELRRRQVEARGRGDAEAQESIARDAEALAGELGKLPADERKPSPGEQAAQATTRAAGSMRQAAEAMRGKSSFAEPQTAAEQDLLEALEALRRLGARSRQDALKRLAEDQDRVRKDAERLQKDVEKLGQAAPGADSGAGELGKAQEEMRGAEKGLRDGRREEALGKERSAKERLEAAMRKLEELEKEVRRLIQLPDYDKLAEKQDGTAENTEELIKKMQQQSQGGVPTPGQNSVEQAKKAMQQASRSLRSRSARSGNSAQKEAVERLEKAKEELEEALRQLREEMQLMLLDAIERRLTEMLQKQEQLFRETIALNLRLRDAGKVARADEEKAGELAGGEASLAGEAEKVIGIIREEGTTVVIPDVLEDLRGDLDGLAARLGKVDAGEYTQRIQQDVIDTLRQLIRVIQEERDRRQGGGQGGEQPPQEGEEPESLLPTSAELKMLHELQARVHKRTQEFDRMVEKEDGERRRIAGKQAAVGDLTKSMADKLNRQDSE